jgi:hypothetical protein
MKQIDDGYKFETTGRTIYAHCGIIGIAEDLDISQGYDGGITIDDDYEQEMTKEEKKELSEFMVDLWKKFAE